jgi:hypothetical protein
LAFFFLTLFFSIEKSSSIVQNWPVLYVADLKKKLLLLLFWHKRKKNSELGLICILKIIYFFLFCGNQGAARVAYPPNWCFNCHTTAGRKCCFPGWNVR